MKPQQAAFDWTPPAAKVAKLGPPSPSLSGAGWEERARTRGYSEAQAKALNDADAGSVLTTETSGRWRWGARRGGYLTATVKALAKLGLIEPAGPVRTTINPLTGDREISPGQVHAYRLTREGLREVQIIKGQITG